MSDKLRLLILAFFCISESGTVYQDVGAQLRGYFGQEKCEGKDDTLIWIIVSECVTPLIAKN